MSDQPQQLCFGNISNCKGKNCNKPIRWIVSPAGKRIPLDATPQKKWVFIFSTWHFVDAYTPHFASCVDSKKFRKDKEDQE